MHEPTQDRGGERHEEHLDASEDDGSAQLQPEDGGYAESPPDELDEPKDS
jgi:hypothetical protein